MASGSAYLSTLLVVLCFTHTRAQGAVDIAFILDGSGSVTRDNYYNVFFGFIQELANRLPLSSNRYQIGIVAFGNDGQIQLEFDRARNSDELQQRLDDPGLYLNENTNTSGGIYVMRTQLFTREAGARDDATRLAILMTDGPSTWDSEKTPIEARLAREADISMYVVGISNPGQAPLDMAEINSIASNPDEDHVTIMDDFQVARDNINNFAIEMVEFIEELAGDVDPPTTRIPVTTTTTEPTRTPRPTTTTEPTRTPRPTTTTTQGPQESEWSCNFQTDEGNPSTCGMMHDREADFVWLPRAGRTPSQNTGPSSAYDANVYMYMEASRPRKPDDDAVMFVPKRVQDGRQCLQFAAHLSGDDIGALEVVRVRGNGDHDLLWSASGEQNSGRWFERSLETVINFDDRGLAFRGIVGDGYKGDIGLDFIRVRSGSC